MNNWTNYQHKQPNNMQPIWAAGGPDRPVRSATYCANVDGMETPGVYFTGVYKAWSCKDEVFFWMPREIVALPDGPKAPLTPIEFAAALQSISADQKADPYNADPNPMFDLLCTHLSSLGYADGAEVLANMQHYFE